MFSDGYQNSGRVSTPTPGSWPVAGPFIGPPPGFRPRTDVGVIGSSIPWSHGATGAPIIRMVQEPLDLNGACKNLIVNYIPQIYTDKNLFDIFVPYGPIHSVKIMRDENTGHSHGYGFVNFLKTDDAIEALKAVHGRRVELNKNLKVSFARPPSDEIKDANLFITNLPSTMTLAELGTLFRRYGPILQKTLLYDKVTGKPRGSAFVRFVFRDDAERAVANLHNFIPFGAWQPMRVKIATDNGRQNAARFIQNRSDVGPQLFKRPFYKQGGPVF